MPSESQDMALVMATTTAGTEASPPAHHIVLEEFFPFFSFCLDAAAAAGPYVDLTGMPNLDKAHLWTSFLFDSVFFATQPPPLSHPLEIFLFSLTCETGQNARPWVNFKIDSLSLFAFLPFLSGMTSCLHAQRCILIIGQPKPTTD